MTMQERWILSGTIGIQKENWGNHAFVKDSQATIKSPYSDQHQISSCNINAYSTPEVMRIKDMITHGKRLVEIG